MPAIAIAGIGAATSIAGGAIGSSAASNAADTAAKGQIEAAKISADSQQKMYNTTRGDQLPYLTGGAGALGRLDYLLGLPGNQTSTANAYKAGYGPQASSYIPSNGGSPVIGYGAPSATSSVPANSPGQGSFVAGAGNKAFQLNGGDLPYRPSPNGKNGVAVPAAQPVSYTSDPSYGSLMHDFSNQDFQEDPGYQFRLSEGQKALDRSAAARGVLGSGSYLKDLTNYNQGAASQEYQDAYNRYQNNRTTKYNFLSNAAGGGQIAANNLSSVGAQYAGNIGQALQTGYGNAANARASGYIGAANAWNGALGGINQSAQNYYQNTRV